MELVAFDTHQFIQTLSQAGMPVAQAEAILTAVRKAHESIDVATKGDVARLEARLDKLDAKCGLLKWMLGFVVIAVLSLVAKAFF